ncbi:MAG: sigma-70 family RNA polymerase sigma factor [Deltaproteobacteria bacterium]|nr:sigma-70 family RNA polymerase sigma factor [Deltaproteobacteria bacterium]
MPEREKPRRRDHDDTGRLLQACSAGDRSAREQLARWCLPRVRRTIALSWGYGPDTEDLIQLVMTRVFAKLDTFRGEARFFTWVDQVAINAVRNHATKKHRVFLASSNPDSLPEPIDWETPERALEQRRLLDQLARHFAAIRPKRRLPLVLSVLHGYSVPEIAAIMGISFDAAKKRLQRGRQDLTARLKRDPRCREAIREFVR